MGKFTEKQRVDAVTAYLTGGIGLRATAKACGVGFDSLRVWVAGYRANGLAGIQLKSRSAYDVDFKLEVLRRVRADSLSYREAAAIFNIRRFDVIGTWERAYQADGVAGLKCPREAKKKTGMSETKRAGDAVDSGEDAERSRSELLREVQQLRMENAYLKKLEALVRDQATSAPNSGRGSCSN